VHSIGGWKEYGDRWENLLKVLLPSPQN